MKGQNYTSIENHQSKTLLPYVGIEINNMMYILIPLFVGGIFATIMTVFIPILMWFWILLAIVFAVSIGLALSLEDEEEHMNFVLLFYYKNIKGYSYIVTAEGEKKVLKKKMIHPYYKRLKGGSRFYAKYKRSR